MKAGRYFIIVILFMGFLILFGNKGLVDYFSLKGKLFAIKATNERIVKENSMLKKKITLLRHDLRYIENIARNELGMVKKGDIIYKFVE
ncbi:MAG: septum formation initiator family protein [Syntrophobacterales bacterium]|nr:septum formation initiator family protein [Syntrophobacterales bacterium]